jgi:hypothetical protein
VLHRRRIKELTMRRTSVSLSIAALVVCAAPAAAQTRATIIPAVVIGGVYDDNVSARAQADAGQMLQMRPSIEADYESPTVSLISLWSFDMQRSNHASLNALDARRHAMADLKWKKSRVTTLGFASRYDRTDSPADIDLDAALVFGRRSAQRWEITPAFMHRIGERTTFNALYDWTTENLVNASAGTLHVARAGLTRELSERTSINGGYLGRLFLDSVSEHQSHAALLGWTRKMAQFTTMSVQAGPRWTTYRGLVPEVTASLMRDGRTLKAGLDYSHGETIILGVLGPVQVDTGSARVNVAATRKIEFGLHTAASKILTIDERAATVYRGTLVGSWSVGGPFTLSASYSADYQLGDVRRNFFRDEKVLRHVFRLGVTIAPSFSRSFLPPDEAARAKGVSR